MRPSPKLLHTILFLHFITNLLLRYLKRDSDEEGVLNDNYKWFHRVLADYFEQTTNMDRRVEVSDHIQHFHLVIHINFINLHFGNVDHSFRNTHIT